MNIPRLAVLAAALIALPLLGSRLAVASTGTGGACRVTGIRGEVVGAATDTWLTFVVENTSGAACQLAGYPDLDLLDGTGSVVGTAVPDALGGDGGPFTPAPTPSTGSGRVILRPGGHAWVWLHYGNRHGSRCLSVAALRVAVAHQHGWVTVPVSFRPCDRVDVTVFTPGP